LFPRTAIDIWQKIQGRDDVVLTVTMIEDYCFEMRDMSTGLKLRTEPYTFECLDYSEHRINCYNDIIEAARTFESVRAVSETRCNSTSSRSHAMVDLTLYKKEGDKIRKTFIRFIDLAGSERQKKTGNDKWNFQGMEGIFTNFSLLTVSKCINGLNALKKPLEDGEEIPRTVFWKEMFLTRVFMRPCFNGRAFCVFNFCISQHEANSGETWCALEF